MILNAYEVIKHSPALSRLKDRTSPICQVLDHSIASDLRAIIGNTNYDLLKEDIIDYSSNNVWNEETNYTEGSTILYEEIPYTALVDVTDDATPPDCSSKWIEAKKFNTDCYNTTWIEGGLRKIIAWGVYARALPFYPELLDVAGFSDESNKETPNRINYSRSNLYSNINLMKAEFLIWNNKNGCLSIGCLPLESQTNNVHRKVNWNDR